MLVQRKKPEGEKSTVQYMNLAVKVVEYTKVGEHDAVKGKAISLPGEPEIVVQLSTKGEAAQMKQRPSVADFRDGKNNCGTEVGGMIEFEGSFELTKDGKPNQPRTFISRWPTVLARKVADEKLVKTNRMVSLTVSEKDSRKFGNLTAWVINSIKPTASLEEAQSVAVKAIDGMMRAQPTSKGAAMVRGLDADGKVIGYAYLYSKYNKEAARSMTGQEVLDAVKGDDWFQTFAKRVATAHSFEVMPAAIISLSTKELNDGKYSSLAGSANRYLVERDDGKHLVARPTTFTLSADEKFVNKAFPNNGIEAFDPVLLTKDGQREYSPEFGSVATNDKEEPKQDEAGLDDIPF